MKGSSVIAIVFLTSDARIGRDRKQMKSNFRAAILIGAAGLCSYVQLACHAQDAASYRANFAPLSQAADKQTTAVAGDLLATAQGEQPADSQAGTTNAANFEGAARPI